MYIFRMAIEVKHMEGTQLPEDCAGACVGVFLRANNIHKAIDLAEKELLDDKYMPVRTYEATDIDIEDLMNEADEDLNEGDPTSEDLLNIYNNGGVWYAAFNLYPPEKNELQ